MRDVGEEEPIAPIGAPKVGRARETRYAIKMPHKNANHSRKTATFARVDPAVYTIVPFETCAQENACGERKGSRPNSAVRGNLVSQISFHKRSIMVFHLYRCSCLGRRTETPLPGTLYKSTRVVSQRVSVVGC